PLINQHSVIKVSIAGEGGKKIPGKIVFDNPVNQQNSRIHILNISIPNPDGNIQSGRLAYVYLSTINPHPVVTIPKSSVIYGADNDYVWVESSENKFIRHSVQIGNHNGSMLQVLNGILSGDRVVSSGAYLINSEYILRYGSGVNLSGMQMSDMNMKGMSH
ncbi:MAG: efflux RND transporter periplasmic adaptor subunit, partial [Chitinophagaceae bacterium]